MLKEKTIVKEVLDSKYSEKYLPPQASFNKIISDSFDIICLSDKRGNIINQIAPQFRRVFLIEEPIFSQEYLGHLDVSQDENGVVIVVPYLPQNLDETAVNAKLVTLIDSFFAEYQICNYICWYHTPMAIAFTRHLQPQAIVYDCRKELSAFKPAPPTLQNYEAELFCCADLVFAGEESLDESRVYDHPNVYIFPDNGDGEGTWAAMMKLLDSSITARNHSHKINTNGAIAGQQAPSIITNQFVFDYLIVGAGFSGSVIAERLASQSGKKVLIIDKRKHIGGNAYDHYDDHGILVHKYGPHIFHTNSREVFEYLSQFTQWRPYEHRVLASVDGQLVPIPINLDTINKLYGMNLNSFQVEEFLKSLAEPKEYIRTSEDVVVSKVGKELYEKFFRGYTRKQWGLDPSELDKSVIARIPTRTNRDNRYFSDTYQAMPLHGLTRMFENMLAHPNIKVMLNTDYREIIQSIPYREMVYTGPVDEFFDYRYGKLPYRSLDFKQETHNTPVFQAAPVINYPNEHLYTRVTEFKYLTGQEHTKTSIVYEFPKAEGDPYYPIPRPENHEMYKKYKALADAIEGVYFVGRLATYKYLNMDQCVAQALSIYKQITVKA